MGPLALAADTQQVARRNNWSELRQASTPDLSATTLISAVADIELASSQPLVGNIGGEKVRYGKSRPQPCHCMMTPAERTSSLCAKPVRFNHGCYHDRTRGNKLV